MACRTSREKRVKCLPSEICNGLFVGPPPELRLHARRDRHHPVDLHVFLSRIQRVVGGVEFLGWLEHGLRAECYPGVVSGKQAGSLPMISSAAASGIRLFLILSSNDCLKNARESDLRQVEFGVLTDYFTQIVPVPTTTATPQIGSGSSHPFFRQSRAWLTMASYKPF